MRFTLSIALLLAALMANECDAWAGSAAPVPATIGQLIRSPAKYAGKLVRVEGQIDNCFGDICNACPDEMTNSTFDVRKCLGISFYGFFGADRLMEQAFRFAVVTFETKFDPSCLVNKHVICLDRVSELPEARVVEVRARHSALDGLVSWYREGKLTPAMGQDVGGMRAELDALGLPTNPERKDDMHYFVLSDHASHGKIGLACLCLEKDCEGHWPTELFLGFESVGNPFLCYLMEKSDAGWRVTSGDF